MLLDQYLRTFSITQVQFAKKIKVDQSTISMYLKGRIPQFEIMKKIYKATNGMVTPNDFYGINEVKNAK